LNESETELSKKKIIYSPLQAAGIVVVLAVTALLLFIKVTTKLILFGQTADFTFKVEYHRRDAKRGCLFETASFF
jgi:hypothetical protein